MANRGGCAQRFVVVASSMFQAIGNTMPSLICSFLRIGVAVIPGLALARLPGFQLRWLWYLAVAGVTLQMILILLGYAASSARDSHSNQCRGIPKCATAERS
jgi:Na+-driven multidrug efflux pump